jgi:flavin-binding protein dodecin
MRCAACAHQPSYRRYHCDRGQTIKEYWLAVTQLTEEITVTLQTGPEEAVRQAIAQATAAMPNVQNVEVKRVEALLENMSVVGYRVMLEVTQSLDPDSQVSSHGDESQLELLTLRTNLR